MVFPQDDTPRSTTAHDRSDRNFQAELFRDASIEMTARDWPVLARAAQKGHVPHTVYIPYLPGEDTAQRIEAAARLSDLGFEPVPHIPARRMRDRQELDDVLGGFVTDAGVRRVLLLAGDIAGPPGAYRDSLSVIRDGALSRNGIRNVGLAGHPEGHPNMPGETPISILRDKIDALGTQRIAPEIVTQFSFDASAVASWLCRIRAAGISAPVAIGLAGPAKVSTLLRFAARCGVGASLRVASQYGLSLSQLLSKAGPETFIAQIGAEIARGEDGPLRAHLYPFGGFAQTASWLETLRSAETVT